MMPAAVQQATPKGRARRQLLRAVPSWQVPGCGGAGGQTLPVQQLTRPVAVRPHVEPLRCRNSGRIGGGKAARPGQCISSGPASPRGARQQLLPAGHSGCHCLGMPRQPSTSSQLPREALAVAQAQGGVRGLGGPGGPHQPGPCVERNSSSRAATCALWHSASQTCVAGCGKAAIPGPGSRAASSRAASRRAAVFGRPCIPRQPLRHEGWPFCRQKALLGLR